MPPLLIELAEHVGFIVSGALIFLAVSPVEMAARRRNSIKNNLLMILFFGTLGILGTYTGNRIFQSYANLRAMSVVAAGLFGGFWVGSGAGLIAGLHRFIIDPWGFSALPCAVATLLEGMGSGLLSSRLGKYRQHFAVAAGICFVGEGLHMILVVAFCRPISQALDLVAIIALPMMVANPIGTGLFIHLAKLLFQRREQRESVQAQTVLDIADRTVGYLRNGLTPESAEKTAKIIYDRLGVAAVSITDTRNILAHVGAGADHHRPGAKILTRTTQSVLTSGRARFTRGKGSVGCHVPGCPLMSAAVVPLKKEETIIGALKLYGDSRTEIDTVRFNIARGLGRLFATQFELENIRMTEQLLTQTQIRHLQAQINPHFLFNSLNTITSFCRTDPGKARELIMDLSHYMRQNLKASRGMIRLSEELAQIHSYIAIETARFGENRIQFTSEVDQRCQAMRIPALLIQPLVENAVRHGIIESDHGSRVDLSVTATPRGADILIRDDGAGMSDQQMNALFSKDEEACVIGGMGLANTRQRLAHFYGNTHGFTITSAPGKGTTIRFSITLDLPGETQVSMVKAPISTF